MTRMPDLPPPPPSGPPPSGPPSGPPPSGPPRAGGRSKVPLIVGGGMVIALAVVVVLVLTLTGSKDAADASSVQDVADVALAAAEDLDVDAGIDLFCDAPSADDRAELDDLIDEARERADTDDPEVDYDVSDVEGDTSGSFAVRVTSDEEGLDDAELEFTVTVESRGGRSCIADVSS